MRGKRIAAMLCLALLELLAFRVFQVNKALQIVLSLSTNAKPSEEGDRHTGNRTGDHEATRGGANLTTQVVSAQGSPVIGGPTPGPFPYYIIRESNKCPERKPPPFLVLLILTVAGEVKARNAIRQTWGNERQAPGLGVVRLFLLGVKEGKLGRLQQEKLEAESLRHRDIIQQDFVDTYYNLTLKVLMGMNWVAMHCPRASYVMKTDSDMFVNTVFLIHKLLRPGVKPKTNYFTGYVFKEGGPIRNKESKWYMPPKEYASKRYPDFCSGTGYVFSGDMARKLYGASLNIPLLRLEDVYMGVCLEWLGLKPTPSPNGLFNPWRVPYSSSAYRNIVTSHYVYPGHLLEYWPSIWNSQSDAVLWEWVV